MLLFISSFVNQRNNIGTLCTKLYLNLNHLFFLCVWAVVSAFSCSKLTFRNKLTESLSNRVQRSKNKYTKINFSIEVSTTERTAHIQTLSCVNSRYSFCNDDDARELDACFWQLTTLFGKCYKMLPPFRRLLDPMRRCIICLKMGASNGNGNDMPLNNLVLKHTDHPIRILARLLSPRCQGFFEIKRKCIFIYWHK